MISQISRSFRRVAAWLPSLVLAFAIVVALTSTNNAFATRDPACDAQPFNQCDSADKNCVKDYQATVTSTHCVDCDGDGSYHNIVATTETYRCYKNVGSGTQMSACQVKTIVIEANSCLY